MRIGDTEFACFAADIILIFCDMIDNSCLNNISCDSCYRNLKQKSQEAT